MSEIETTDAPDIAVTGYDPATVQKRIGQYIDVRNALKKMADEHDARTKGMRELQEMLTGWMQKFLETAGADSVKTKLGTVYNTTRYSASLADPEAFMKFVRDTGNFDLLDRKANVTACKEYVAEHNTLPPGVNMSAIKTVGVRAPTKKTT